MLLRQNDCFKQKTAVEYVRCNLCGGDDTRLYFEQNDRRYRETPRDTFTLVRCESCGLIYLNPRPTTESILLFYPAKFYDGLDEPHEMRAPQRRRWRRLLDVRALRGRLALREKVQIVARCHRQQGNLLDVGPGRGGFLRAMKDLGWSVTGVDISTDMCEHIRKRHGITCIASDFATLSYPANSIDVVTFWASFEHQRDPASALDLCRSILTPGGSVVILVPNARSIEERLLKCVDPNPIDVPRHLYHFSEETLRLMLRRKGFAVTAVRHFTLNACGRVSVVANAGAAKIPMRSGFDTLGRFLIEAAGLVTGDVLARVLSTAGRAHSFILIARKA
jgi:SAM-dependent methyltransferase